MARAKKQNELVWIGLGVAAWFVFFRQRSVTAPVTQAGSNPLTASPTAAGITPAQAQLLQQNLANPPAPPAPQYGPPAPGAPQVQTSAPGAAAVAALRPTVPGNITGGAVLGRSRFGGL